MSDPYMTPAPPPYYGGMVMAPQNGFGTAALVLGIIGLFLGPLSVLGIIFGAIGQRKADAGLANNRGLATAGLVTGIIGAVGWVIVLFLRMS
jgi:hypothetical protein